MNNSCPFCHLLLAAEKEPTFICEFANSVAFLNFDQERYAGMSLFVLKEHHEHLHLTPIELQQAVMPELVILTAAILKSFGGFRANHQSLGNQVSHLHWHVVPRYPNDCNAGGPPQHSQTFKKMTDDEYRESAARIRACL